MQNTPERNSKPESPASKEKFVKPGDLVLTDLCFLHCSESEVSDSARTALTETFSEAEIEMDKKHGKSVVKIDKEAKIWIEEHHGVVFVEIGTIEPAAKREGFTEKFIKTVGNGGYAGLYLKPKKFILGVEMSDDLWLRNIFWGKLCGQIYNRFHEHLTLPPHLHSTHVFWVPIADRFKSQEVLCNTLNRALSKKSMLAKEGKGVWKGFEENLNEMTDEYFSPSPSGS